MFKLIKIVGSGVNVPEPVKAAIPASNYIPAGTPIFFESGGLITTADDENPATHITLSDTQPDGSIMVFEITPNMLFETVLEGDPNNLGIGSKVALSCDSEGISRAVAPSPQGRLTVHDVSITKFDGDKIIVKF